MKVQVRRRKRGQSLIEVITGALVFIIPVSIAGLNLITLVLINQANDHLAKSCARAAANQQSLALAQQAAQKCIAAFPKSSLIVDVHLSGPVKFDQDKVAVTTEMNVKIPTIFPGMDKFNFKALGVEPVVGIRADI